MSGILVFSYLTIAALSLIIVWSMSVIRLNLKEKYKIIPLAILHFIIYCLLKYAIEFILWTIRLDKFDSYPYRNPFFILVIIYCIISFIIMGRFYIKNKKNECGVKKIVFLLFTIHILSIFLLMFFCPF